MNKFFKPFKEWNALFVGLALIPFIGLIFMIFSGECLNPYEGCKAGLIDYSIPAFLVCMLLTLAGKK